MEPKWHTRPVSEVLKMLESNENGLSGAEAARRLEENGLNKLPEAKTESVLAIFLRQFKSPLIYILLFAALAVWVIGETIDGVIILAVLLFNAAIGSVQEGRARNTLLALKKFIETKAAVIRDGSEIVIPDTGVVVGDIIALQEGDKIPADARIMEARNLKLDEAALTGESEAVRKTSEAIDNPNLPTMEEKNMAFRGTNIVSGRGRAIVVRVGTETVVGKIAKEIASIETEIPLKANIRYLSRLIISVTAVASAIIFALGIQSGQTAIKMLTTVISICVSVIPEGLPVAITVILATGVWRMSKRNALIKRLQAVEALGQASIIAVDKTGTITKNEMMVRSIYIGGKNFELGGIGYEPKGNVRLEGQVIEPHNHQELLMAGKIAAFCSNASVMFDTEKKLWKISGDPTEAALAVLAEKLSFNKTDLERESPLITEIPFDYSLKYHATLHKNAKENMATVVGAPEVILGLSSEIWRPDGESRLSAGEKGELEKIFIDMSMKGLRVIAAGIKHDQVEDFDVKNIKDLVFLGFFGLKDALRPEVKESTRRAIAAGIKVVMITGDHVRTAETLAGEAGIYKRGDKSLTGMEIDGFSDKTLAEKLAGVSVFARVTPEHKLRIIEAYKRTGNIVAMTGDGVNDAPSLVAANLGVAMGRIGTEVAKESSDIILLDDNFGSIISAVEEGRNIYKTIEKVVLYLLSTSIGELLVITGAILLGFPLPLLPTQIIWLNFVTDGFFTVGLALEPREKGLLTERFEKPEKYLVSRFMAGRMLIMAAPMMIGTLVLFRNYFETDLAKAWTISLTVLAVFQWFNAWNCRSEKESVFRADPFENKYMVLATGAAFFFQLLAVYHPFFQRFLHTVPLELSEWFIIIAFASSILLAEEFRKSLSWHKQKSWSSSAPQPQASQA